MCTQKSTDNYDNEIMQILNQQPKLQFKPVEQPQLNQPSIARHQVKLPSFDVLRKQISNPVEPSQLAQQAASQEMDNRAPINRDQVADQQTCAYTQPDPMKPRYSNYTGGSVIYLNHANRALPTLQPVHMVYRSDMNNGPSHNSAPDVAKALTRTMMETPINPAPSQFVDRTVSSKTRHYKPSATSVHPYARPSDKVVLNTDDSHIPKAATPKDSRVKNFEMERLEVGTFKLEARSDDRSRWTNNVKVSFAMRRLIYEFPFREQVEKEGMIVCNLRNYAVVVPFEAMSMIKQEGSAITVVLKDRPLIFDSKTMLEMNNKNIKFDPTVEIGTFMGNFKSVNVHQFQLRDKQADSFISLLLEHDRAYFQKIIKLIVPCSGSQLVIQ
jgi:hypothetical protein